MNLSGTVTAVSEVTSLMPGLIAGKSGDTESITDSMLETSSVREATSTGVSSSHQVSTLHICKILSLYKIVYTGMCWFEELYLYRTTY